MFVVLLILRILLLVVDVAVVVGLFVAVVGVVELLIWGTHVFSVVELVVLCVQDVMVQVAIMLMILMIAVIIIIRLIIVLQVVIVTKPITLRENVSDVMEVVSAKDVMEMGRCMIGEIIVL